jgi:hypothetical protein
LEVSNAAGIEGKNKIAICASFLGMQHVIRIALMA